MVPMPPPNVMLLPLELMEELAFMTMAPPAPA
jgi:hypothetical protein